MTDIKFLFWKLSLSRVLIILGSFAFGIVVGLLISLKKNRLPK
ncbi:LapA family protein [Cellulophaga sp. Z1A5H]